MITKSKGLVIELESENEVNVFWNIVAFALDLHNERTEKGESCMTKEELQMAHWLYDVTKEKQ